MLKILFPALGLALLCAGSATDAAAMSKWEKALIQRYAKSMECDGRNAPAWGRASMRRWRAAERARQRYDR